MAVHSFARPELKIFFETGKVPKKAPWQNIKKLVARKLDLLNYAHVLNDLKSPPANRLELLRGDFEGFYSIRVNDQWRVVFSWTQHGAEQVCIVDYH